MRRRAIGCLGMQGLQPSAHAVDAFAVQLADITRPSLLRLTSTLSSNETAADDGCPSQSRPHPSIQIEHAPSATHHSTLMTQPRLWSAAPESKPQPLDKSTDPLADGGSESHRPWPLRGGPTGRNHTAGFCRVQCRVSASSPTAGNGWFPTEILCASEADGMMPAGMLRSVSAASCSRTKDRAPTAELNPASGCSRAILHELNRVRNLLQGCGRSVGGSIRYSSRMPTSSSARRR